MSTYITLFASKGQTIFYSHGTRICTGCGLHPDTCEEVEATPSKIRAKKKTPDCLVAYAWHKLPGNADDVLELVEAIAAHIAPDSKFIAAYEAMIDTLAAAARRYPEEDTRWQRQVRQAAWATLAQGLSAAAFVRAVDIYEDRRNFEARIAERRAA